MEEPQQTDKEEDKRRPSNLYSLEKSKNVIPELSMFNTMDNDIEPSDIKIAKISHILAVNAIEWKDITHVVVRLSFNNGQTKEWIFSKELTMDFEDADTEFEIFSMNAMIIES